MTLLRKTSLKAGVGLKRKTTLKRGTTELRRSLISLQSKSILKSAPAAPQSSLDRPLQTPVLKTKKQLIANPARTREASKYHDDVFAAFGPQCRLCDRRHPAHVAAHVIKRSELGCLRYADVRFARPAHDDCHQIQEANLRDFSLEIRVDATLAYNALTRNKLKLVPTQ